MKGNNQSLLERKRDFDTSNRSSVRNDGYGPSNYFSTAIKSARKPIFSDYPVQNQNRSSHRTQYETSPARVPQTKMEIALARAKRAREISKMKNCQRANFGYSESEFGNMSYISSSQLGMSLNINTNINILTMTENQQMNQSGYSMSQQQSQNQSSSVTKIVETKSLAIPESLLPEKPVSRRG
jgi:hypothetical protein